MEWSNNIRLFFKKQNTQNLLIAFLALSFVWPAQFLSKIFLPKAVDPSWMIVLSETWEKNWVFGKDIVFTYGPLAFLSTRVVLHSTILPLLCFDLFFASSFVYIIYNILKEKQTTTRIAMILITCFLFKYALFLSLVFTLQCMVLLYLQEYKKQQRIWLLLHALFTTALIFYIKLNMAFIGTAVFFLFVAHLYISKYLSAIKAAGAALLLCAAILLASLVLPVNLIAYIKSGIALINSYNDAAYVYPTLTFEKGLEVLIVGAFLCMVYVIAKFSWHKPAAEKCVAVIFLLLSFVVFKQSYVRGDIEHIKDFFYVFPALLAVYMYISNNTNRLIFYLAGVLWCAGIFINLHIYKDYCYPFKKIASIPAYFNSMYEGFDYYAQLSKDGLPENIKKQIGTATVDIIPWEAGEIILSKLNYNPRPVIQSYQAYNETLDKLNAEKYASENGPEYVIYGTNSIDVHYNFFDDTQVKKIMYLNYSIIDSFYYGTDKMILFKRARVHEQKDFRRISTSTKAMKESVEIPQSKFPVLVKIKMNYSAAGEMQRILLRTPYSTVTLTQKKGSAHTFQAATSILEGGVFIDYFVESGDDAINYFTHSLQEERKIKTIQIDVAHPICWQDSVRYEWFELR